MEIYFACLAFFLLGMGVMGCIWVSEIKIKRYDNNWNSLHPWGDHRRPLVDEGKK